MLAIVPLALLSIYLAVDDGRKDAARAQGDSREAVRLVTQDLNRLIQSSSDLVQGLSRYAAIRPSGSRRRWTLASIPPCWPARNSWPRR